MGDKRVDCKAFSMVGRDLPADHLKCLRYHHNVWLACLPTFRPALERLHAEMDQCQLAIGEAISLVLEQAPGYW